MNQQPLKQRVQNYIEDSGIPRTTFCKRINISTGYLYKWLHNERTFSDEVVERIEAYLNKYGY